MPRGEQEFGEVDRGETGRDLASGLRLRDALGEGRAPFPKDLIEAGAQQLALAGRLEAEIADQAAAAPVVGFELAGDDVEIAQQPLARRERRVVQRLGNETPHIGEVAIE